MSATRKRRRVAITGIGLVTPVGIGRDETWNALVAGKSGIGPITLFDVTEFATKFAGEVKAWEPTRWIEKRDAKTYDRFLQFGVVASQLAKDDANLTIDALLDVLEGDSPSMAALLVRKAELIVKHAGEWVAPESETTEAQAR